MKLFSLTSLQQLMLKIPFFKQQQRSLGCLNTSQFLGVVNDNIFKLVFVFLMIDVLGAKKSGLILSSVGAIYVLPFLLFSSIAGVIADRFSKQRLILVMKLVEMLLMLLAVVAFGFKHPSSGYLLLFFLSMHSALFGPSKYGIIAELVPSDKISKANGLVTSFTYLGVIVGTFLASFLTDVTNRRFALVAAFCFLLASIGFLSALGIKRTPPQGSKKRISPLFVREIFQTLIFCKPRKHLLISILGSSYFLFIGAFTQLNIIPFAIDSLSLTEVAGGYLFLLTAIGIAIGAYISGKASKKQIELGLSALSIIALSILFFLIALFSQLLGFVIAFLILIGIFGGMFIVPFDSFTQMSSPNEKRGQVIAAANFLSFCGVLLASFILYLFGEVLALSPAEGFAMIGLVTAIASLCFCARLSDLLLSFLGRKVIAPLQRITIEETSLIEKARQPLLVLEQATWSKICLVQAALPHCHFFFPSESAWLKSLFHSMHSIPMLSQREALIDAVRSQSKESWVPCLVLKGKLPHSEKERKAPLLKLFGPSAPALIRAALEPTADGRGKRLSFSDLT
jgi:acyl-[acyl-carrier-protein]-phospholipid O-acyltransferase / long-chain-fatty-acid--[acyl-carrier-protein] ligase